VLVEVTSCVWENGRIVFLEEVNDEAHDGIQLGELGIHAEETVSKIEVMGT